MCGRYRVLSEEAFEELFRIADGISEKYGEADVVKEEAFPSSFVPVIYSHRGKNILSTAKWGFPGFKGNGVIINARAESVAKKPMFREAFLTQRCLVPAGGYYEWLTGADKKKTKYHIGIKDKGLFYMAGLYSLFEDKNGRVYAAVAVITTQAHPDIAFIHDRMPVLLPEEEIPAWLDTNTGEDSLQKLMSPYNGGMEYRTV